MFKLIAKLIYTVLLFIEMIVALRFIFDLADISTDNAIVKWIVDMSDVLISPFTGIVNGTFSLGDLVFDLTTIVALICYMMIAFVAVELIRTFSR